MCHMPLPRLFVSLRFSLAAFGIMSDTPSHPFHPPIMLERQRVMRGAGVCAGHARTHARLVPNEYYGGTCKRCWDLAALLLQAVTSSRLLLLLRLVPLLPPMSRFNAGNVISHVVTQSGHCLLQSCRCL